MSLPDGRTLAWRETGSGPPLVLLHGWAGSGLVFAELAASLAERFRVLLPDLPGHGDSFPASDPGLSTFADDLSAWLAAQVPQAVHLAGWSLGGMVALELARREPQRYAQLVLVGTTPRFVCAPDWPHGLPLGQVRAMRRNLERRFVATLADFFSLAVAGETWPAERLEAIRRTMIKAAPLPDSGTAAALLDLLAGQDQRQVLAAIRTPALVLHGENDRIVPLAAAEQLATELPSARLVRFAQVGHAPFWSRPQSVVQLLTEAQT